MLHFKPKPANAKKRPMHGNMDHRHIHLLLRWLTPLLIAALGVGFTLWNHLVLESEQLSGHVIREALFFGTVGPLLAWLTLGWAIALAEAKARATEELERRNRALLLLNAVGETASQSLELQEILDGALDRILGFMSLEAGSVWVLEGSALRLKSHRLVSANFVECEATVPLGECLCGLAAQRGQLMQRQDVDSDSGMTRPACLAEGFCSVMSVPLQAQGRSVGVMHLASRSRRTFSSSEEQLLATVGHQVAIALKNAELYSQVRQFSERLEQQVEERTGELAQAREALAEKAKQLQRLLATTISIQEEERARIAQDLHDESNQLITGALYEIQAAQESVRGQRGEIALAKLETAKSLMRKIDDVNRWIISGLRPPILDAQGLVQALKWHADTYQKSYRTPCVVQVSGRPDRIAPEVETAIYRIVQESLNNVAAHARAQSVHIWIEFRPTRLRVVVEDDGVGFNYESVLTAAPGQMGLIGMRERAQSIGGRIEVQSAPSQGTRLVLDVPLPIESALDVVSP